MIFESVGDPRTVSAANEAIAKNTSAQKLKYAQAKVSRYSRSESLRLGASAALALQARKRGVRLIWHPVRYPVIAITLLSCVAASGSFKELKLYHGEFKIRCRAL